MSDLSSNLTETLRMALLRHPSRGRLWLGFSGGLDSSVLLHLLVSAGLPVKALHIHHGLSARADSWQAHCQAQASRLGVPFQAVQVTVDSRAGGLEQGAREARYQAFAEAMAPGDQILLAHHGDDQVETLLLRLMRGAGPRGLAGMEECRGLGEGKTVLRPLLGTARADLERYAKAHGLDWIEDDSNADLSLDRNYIRSQVLPSLAARWPVVNRVSRAVENLRESADMLEALAGEDRRACGERKERFGESINMDGFRALSVARQKNLLRGWIGACGGEMPESAQLTQALAQSSAAADAQPAVSVGGLVMRRYRDRLYLTPQLAPDAESAEEEPVWRWNGVGNLVLPGGWTLSPASAWPEADYIIRYRVGGERAQPSGRDRSQTLKKLLQEYALEPWLRGRVPLVYRGDQLVAVGDLFVTTGGPPEPPNWRFLD